MSVDWDVSPEVLAVLVDIFDPRRPPEWQDRALCAQTDPEAFFPEKGGSTAEAKRICRACDVRAECLQYALDHDERFGVYGGLSERERRKLKPRPATPAIERTTRVSRDTEIARLGAAGVPPLSIAEQVGVDRRTVYRARKRNTQTAA